MYFGGFAINFLGYSHFHIAFFSYPILMDFNILRIFLLFWFSADLYSLWNAASQNVGVISCKAKAALLYRHSQKTWLTMINRLIQPNTGAAFFMIADSSLVYMYFDLYTLPEEPSLSVLEFDYSVVWIYFHVSLLILLIDFRNWIHFKNIPCFSLNFQNNLDPFQCQLLHIKVMDILQWKFATWW